MERKRNAAQYAAEVENLAAYNGAGYEAARLVMAAEQAEAEGRSGWAVFRAGIAAAVAKVDKEAIARMGAREGRENGLMPYADFAELLAHACSAEYETSAERRERIHRK